MNFAIIYVSDITRRVQNGFFRETINAKKKQGFDTGAVSGTIGRFKAVRIEMGVRTGGTGAG